MAERKIDLLLQYARDHARSTGLLESDPDALQKMFWKIWAHPDLIGLWLVTHSLSEILVQAKLMWTDHPSLLDMERWPFLLNWLKINRSVIVAKIGIDEGNKKKDPMKYHGFQLDAVYSAFCREHAPGDESYKKNYRLLQAHILIAFGIALEEQDTSARYKQVCSADQVVGESESGHGPEIEREPLTKSCYLVGRALRRLNINDPGCTALLKALPLNLLPSRLASWIETFTFTPTINDSSRSLENCQTIQHFLTTIYKAHWKRVASGADGKAESTERESIHGRAQFGTRVSAFQLPQTESAWQDNGEFYFYADPLSEEERRALGKFEDESDQPAEFYSAERPKTNTLRRRSWKDNNRRIMANQVLPYDFDELNGSDLGRVWKHLGNWWNVYGQDKSRRVRGEKLRNLEVGAMLWVMLWTASSIERAKSLHITEDPDDPNHGLLSLLITSDEDNVEIKHWRIAALPPRADIEIPRGSRQVIDHVLLPDLCNGSAWVIQLWRQLGRPAVVFKRSLQDYKDLIGQLFEEVRQTDRIANPLTAVRYSKVLFWRLLRRSGHDFSAVSMVIGQDHQLNRSRLHYTTRQVEDMQELYLDCAQALVAEIARFCSMRFTRTDFRIQDKEDHLGARHCPTVETVKSAVIKLRTQIDNGGDIKIPNCHDERKALKTAHNELTLYTYWMFAFATGIRAIVDPYRQISLADFSSGILPIDDKKASVGGKGYKNRLVWLPPVLQEQMAAYDNYLNELKRTCGITSQHPCFFLELYGERLLPVLIRPAELERQIADRLPFPVNTQRLFLRSELLQNGCGAELVDAFLGHWSLGEEPWARYSTFNYKVYFAALEVHIKPLLEKIGFKVLHKRIVC